MKVISNSPKPFLTVEYLADKRTLPNVSKPKGFRERWELQCIRGNAEISLHKEQLEDIINGQCESWKCLGTDIELDRL